MRLRYTDGSRSSDILAEAHHRDATVADLEEALDPDRPAGPLWVDGHRVRAATPLDRAGIADGSVVSLDPPPATSSMIALVEVWVTSGFDSGRRHRLTEGHHVLGRAGTAAEGGHAVQIVVADPTVSRRHADLAVAADGSVMISDLGSTNGTWLDGNAITEPTPLDSIQEVRVGVARLIIRRSQNLVLPSPVPSSVDGSTRPRHRAIRAIASTPLDPIHPPPPPESAPAVTPIGIIALVASVGVGLAMVVVMRSWTYAMFALLGPVLMVANTLDSRHRRRRARRTGGRKRRAALAAFEIEIGQRARHEVACQAERFAGLHRAEAAINGPAPTCWDRRSHHADAYQIRLGFGPTPWVPPIVGVAEAWAPDVATVVDRHRSLVDAAVGLRLEPGRAVAVVGPPGAARALARSIVLQAAVSHGPADLQVAALIGDDQAREWDWLGWLPHARDPIGGSLLGAGVKSMTAVGSTLAASSAVASDQSPVGPHRLVVIDDSRGMTERRHPAWTVVRAALDPGTSLIPLMVLHDGDPVPAQCALVLTVHANGELHAPPALASGPVALCGASLDVVTDLARRLAAYDDPEVDDPGRGLPDQISLLALIGAERTTTAGFVAQWSAGGHDPAPRAVLGCSTDGPMTIDLATDGPHVLVAGTTGSGKSELLRSLITSLAANSSPDHLTFVLIDFKGGSAFDACARLPHTTGLVTDLDQHLAARALRCLEAELHYRERFLRVAGATDLDHLRRLGIATPLARLVVVIDEFASLAAALPDFVEALVDIAQRGRSLGVHLVLATQRPSGSVSESIRANIGLRIALRVQSREDSSDVIGAPDAVDLPRHRPGRALVRLGPGELIPLQTATASGHTGGDRPSVVVCPLTIAATGSGAGSGDPAAVALAVERSDLDVLVDAMVSAWAQTGGSPVRRPWPDPLPTELSWPLLADPPGQPPTVVAGAALVLGLADDPDHQQHRPFAWLLDEGPLVAVGLPGSGTSTLAATVVLAAAERWTPDSCHVHVIDMGTGTLLPLAALAHVGAVIGADQVERQRRLMAELAEEMDRRRSQPTSGPPRQAGCGAGRGHWPRRILVVDGLGGFRSRWGDLDPSGTWDRLLDLAAGGAAVGIHICCTAEGSAMAPHRLLAASRQRLVFRLGDPTEHGVFGIAARDVPPLPPGRAVATDGPTIVQVARPSEGLAAAVARLTAPVAGLTCDLAPTWIGVLPDRVCHGSISQQSCLHPGGGLDLVIGLADRGLKPAALALPPGGHGLVAGPPRSGRSLTLLALAHAAAQATGENEDPDAPAPPVRVVLVTKLPVGNRVAPDREAGSHRWEIVDPDSHRLHELLHHLGPLLVLVDDADQTTEAHEVLAQLVTERRADRHVVVAGRNDRLRSAYGHWTREVRADGTGLLLMPDLDLDGDLTSSRLPRHPAVSLVPGRAWLAGTDSAAEGFIQVALPAKLSLLEE